MWIRILTVLSLLLIGFPVESEAETHRFAILVGNNVGDINKPALLHAQRDALKVASVLHEIGGFPQENITILLGSKASNIRLSLQKTHDKIAALREDPNNQILLVFYFSGHGEPQHIELGSSRLAMDEVKAFLKDSPATMRLGIVDACHSGALIRTKGARRETDRKWTAVNELTSQGYAILTSSAASETSQESDELRGSFFTHALVSGLRGDADYSGDDNISLSELYRYTYFTTLEQSQASNAQKQHPRFESSQEGDLVLTRLSQANALITFPSGPAGDYVIFQPDTDTVVAEVHKKAGEARSIAVQSGSFDIYQHSDSVSKKTRVRLEKNKEVVLDVEAMTPVEEISYAKRGAGLSVSLSAGAGYQWFHKSAFTNDYVNNTPLFGVETRIHNIGTPGLDLRFDALFSVAEQEIKVSGAEIEQDFFEIQIGTALVYRIQWEDFHLAFGPRLSWLMFRRHLADDLLTNEQRVQTFSTIIPGGLVEVGYRFHSKVSVTATARIGYLHFEADATSYDLATTESLLHVQYLF